MTNTKKVVLAYPYTVDDTTHEADTELDLDRHEANRLLKAGLARPVTQVEPPKPDTIPAILEEVGTDKDKAAAALAAEQAGKGRPTLIEKLSAIANNTEEN